VQTKIFWPLNESSGPALKIAISDKKSNVVNPHWLKSRHSNWDFISSCYPHKGSGCCFLIRKENYMLIAEGFTVFTFFSRHRRLLQSPWRFHMVIYYRVINPYLTPINPAALQFLHDQHFVTEFNLHKISGPIIIQEVHLLIMARNNLFPGRIVHYTFCRVWTFRYKKTWYKRYSLATVMGHDKIAGRLFSPGTWLDWDAPPMRFCLLSWVYGSRTATVTESKIFLRPATLWRVF